MRTLPWVTLPAVSLSNSRHLQIVGAPFLLAVDGEEVVTLSAGALTGRFSALSSGPPCVRYGQKGKSSSSVTPKIRRVRKTPTIDTAENSPRSASSIPL